PRFVRALENPERDALLNRLLRQEALNIGAEVPAVFCRRIASVAFVLAVNLALLVRRVEVPRPSLRNQNRRIALVAILGLKRGPQLTTTSVRTGNARQQAARGAKCGANGVDDLDVGVCALVAVEERQFVQHNRN